MVRIRARRHLCFMAFCTALLVSYEAVTVRTASGQPLATIAVDVSRTNEGEYRYEYLVTNPPIGDFSINAFVLDVGAGASIQMPVGPTEWIGDYDAAEDPYELVFISSGASFDIPIGGMVTFVFTSPLVPAPMNFFLSNISEDGSDQGSVFGQIDAPAFPRFSELAGDFNNDGTVDAADYPLWRDGLEAIYDEADYNAWRDNFGETSSMPSGELGSVPGPSAGILAWVALSGCQRRRYSAG